MSTLCRVCLQGEVHFFLTQKELNYWRCPVCQATMMDSSGLPQPQEELEQYCKHQNNPLDPNYRKFLDKLASPLLRKLLPNSQGLDYGCGPGPALAWMLREAGHRVRLYDPFFHPGVSALQLSYDFVACAEVVEHFHRPYEEFAFLDRLLLPGGWLGIMTSFQLYDELFGQWRYRRDPTHVTFYKQETFHVLAGIFGWSCEVPRKNVVLMQKPLGNRKQQEPECY